PGRVPTEVQTVRSQRLPRPDPQFRHGEAVVRGRLRQQPFRADAGRDDDRVLPAEQLRTHHVRRTRPQEHRRGGRLTVQSVQDLRHLDGDAVRRFLATVLAIALVAATPSAAWSDEGPQLTSVGPVKVWVGLKNSDDVGTKFDLLAEAYQDDTLVTSGHLDNVAGGSSGFNNAILQTIALDPFSAVEFPAGSQLKFKL